MLLVTDLGNTCLKLSIYDKEKKIAFIVNENNEDDDYLAIIRKFLYKNNLKESMIHDCIISNSLPYALKALKKACLDLTGKDPIVIDEDSKLGIKVEAKNLNGNLIAIGSYLYNKLKSELIFVSFGHTTTICHINNEGIFKDYIVAPGYQYFKDFPASENMNEVEVKETNRFIGSNNDEALNIGTYHGYTGMVSYLLAGLKGEIHSTVAIVACGGYGKDVVNGIKSIQYYDPDMGNKALNYIYMRYYDETYPG